jgi:lysozyme family protein
MSSILKEILQNEGGYQDHKEDTGNYVGNRNLGTNFGITPKVLAEHRGVPASSLTKFDMQSLRKKEAAEIYENRYIKPFSKIKNKRLRDNVIDMGVNSGVSRATRLLQRALGEKEDGVIGPKTLKALGASKLSTDDYSDLRDSFYESVIASQPDKAKYRDGWLNRSNRFRTQGNP